ncbi:MAG: NAD(+) synthase [Myxococcales bacterium]|jgi:NAD+ synthase (glutamine-hydrolysing)
MKLVKIAAAALNTPPLDWKGNLDKALACIEEARAQGASLLCLPELCLPGYGCEDAFHARGVQERALRSLEQILPATRGMVVSLGLPLAYQNALLDAACLIADGRLLGFVPKQHLAGDGIHYEPRWFKPWPAGRRASVTFAGERVPLGDLVFEVGGVRLGFEICEDAWVAQRPGAALARHGVDIILNPSASHFAFGKRAIRERLVVEGSRAFGVSYVYSNLLGNEAGRVVYDGGTLLASGGRIIARGPRFSFLPTRVTSAVIDVDATRTVQVRTASFEPDFAADEGCVRAHFGWPKVALEASRPAPEPMDTKEEELARAVALGLFDYLRKSHAEGFVVSLSGGADSSAVASLCALTVQLAWAELGREGFAAALSHVRGIGEAASARDAVRRLLTCVYQATRNSTDTTRNAARTLAEALGAEHIELDVEAMVAGYRALVEKGIGRSFDWATDDLTLQNIQARARGPSVWMIANARNALLLATSNRSEAAVGYATMDGDTCGGLSPIAGVDKAYLRHWLRWLEKTGPKGLHPIPELEAVSAQAPTAELRPPDSNQTDEADLMPYEVLDAIERFASRDKQLPLEVYARLVAEFPAREPRQLAAWVVRFFRLWCRNQWKRERYAPSFHLDDENLDPRSWCRFPILSSGFEEELEELTKNI